jgi:hypothetical protein
MVLIAAQHQQRNDQRGDQHHERFGHVRFPFPTSLTAPRPRLLGRSMQRLAFR